MRQSNKPLSRLQVRYSSALYWYFRVTNLKQSFEAFQKQPVTGPGFRYAAQSSLVQAKKRLKRLQAEFDRPDLGEKTLAFLNWRVAETRLLIKFWKIKATADPPERLINEYLAAQIELYGPLDAKLFGGIMAHLRKLAARRGPKYITLMNQVKELVGDYEKARLYAPTEQTFHRYKDLYHRSLPQLQKVLVRIKRAEHYSTDEIVAIFNEALAAIDADKAGWQAVADIGGANVVISRFRKRVIVSDQFRPLSTLRLKQVVAHELSHIHRAINDPQTWHYPKFDEQDEGLAILTEQLLAPRFMHKRVMRYFAISLAVGADGRKRDFREVYEIMWRAVAIVSGNGGARIKQQAFYETARAFRGGFPELKGGAYIKDKVYLEGNLKVWQKLSAKQLSLREFRKLFYD